MRPKTVYEDDGLIPLGPAANPLGTIDAAPELSDGMLDVEVGEQVHAQDGLPEDAPADEEGIAAG